MNKLLEALKGHRTYMAATAAVVVIVLYMASVISKDTAELFVTLLGFGGLAALRSALKTEMNSGVDKFLDSIEIVPTLPDPAPVNKQMDAIQPVEPVTTTPDAVQPVQSEGTQDVTPQE